MVRRKASVDAQNRPAGGAAKKCVRGSCSRSSREANHTKFSASTGRLHAVQVSYIRSGKLFNLGASFTRTVAVLEIITSWQVKGGGSSTRPRCTRQGWGFKRFLRQLGNVRHDPGAPRGTKHQRGKRRRGKDDTSSRWSRDGAEVLDRPGMAGFTASARLSKAYVRGGTRTVFGCVCGDGPSRRRLPSVQARLDALFSFQRGVSRTQLKGPS